MHKAWRWFLGFVFLLVWSIGEAQTATVNLAWDYIQDPVNPADGFIVYRCTGVGCTNFQALMPAPLSVNILTYADTTLANGTVYSWIVRATGQGILSDPSNTLTFQTPGKPARPDRLRKQ